MSVSIYVTAAQVLTILGGLIFFASLVSFVILIREIISDLRNKK